jgi:hypothetical protein
MTAKNKQLQLQEQLQLQLQLQLQEQIQGSVPLRQAQGQDNGIFWRC